MKAINSKCTTQWRLMDLLGCFFSSLVKYSWRSSLLMEEWLILIINQLRLSSMSISDEVIRISRKLTNWWMNVDAKSQKNMYNLHCTQFILCCVSVLMFSWRSFVAFRFSFVIHSSMDQSDASILMLIYFKCEIIQSVIDWRDLVEIIKLSIHLSY